MALPFQLAILPHGDDLHTQSYVHQGGDVDETVTGTKTFSGAIVIAAIGPAAGQQHTLPAVGSDTIALLAATQSLSNKTLIAPTIASFANAAHSHESAAGGGPLTEAALANRGTSTTVLHGNAAGSPTWGKVALTTDVSGTLQAAQFPALTGDVTTPGASLATTLAASGVVAGSYTKVTVDAKGRVTVGASATLASADFANQGTSTTVLHGHGAGNPSWGAVNLAADVSGTLPVARGGTGQTSYTSGQVLIGTAAGGLAKTTLTEGAGISITNGDGTITLATTGQVPTSRTLATTSPLAGGGDLSADRTFSLAGLNSLGTANYVVGVNAAAGGWEYKQLVEGANVTITHGVGTVTIAGSAATTVNGLSGAVTLAAGTGIDIPAPVGQTITVSNSGVTSVAGTANQVVVSGATGAVTFSLPQSIATASTPQFGSLTLADALAVGTDATLAGLTGLTSAAVTIADTQTSTGPFEGNWYSHHTCYLTVNPSAHSGANYQGLWLLTVIPPGNDKNITGVSAGMTVEMDHGGTGVISTAAGAAIESVVVGSGTIIDNYWLYLSGGVDPGSGTVVNDYGVYVSPGVSAAGGTVGTHWGVYVSGPLVLGTMTTNYGVYLADQTGAGTSYALYSAGGPSYHAGALALNSTLTLAGALAAGANATLTGTPLATATFTFADTVTAFGGFTADAYALNLVDLTVNPADHAPATTYTGQTMMATVPGACAKNLAVLQGVLAGATHAGSGTVSAAVGVNYWAMVTGVGTVADNFGAYVQTGTATAAGHIDRDYAVYIASGAAVGSIGTHYSIYVANAATAGGGSITTNYGLYIEDQVGGGTNYAIYAAGGAAHFGGPLTLTSGGHTANATFTQTGAAEINNVLFFGRLDPAAHSAGTFAGLHVHMDPEPTCAFNFTGAISAVTADPHHNGAGTINQFQAVNSSPIVFGGAVTYYRGTRASVLNSGGAITYGECLSAQWTSTAGTTQQAYGLHVYEISPGNGVGITTYYGVRVRAGQGTTRWAFYADSDPSYFGSQVVLPTSSATAPALITDTTSTVGYSLSGTGTSGVHKWTINQNSVMNLRRSTFFGLTLAANMGYGFTAAAYDADNATVDTILVRDAAAVLALKNADVAQTLRVYGATTGAKYLSLTHDGAAATIASTFGALNLTTPTIADFTNAGHSHQDAAGGGTLDAAALAAGTLATARGGTGVDGSGATAGQLLIGNAAGGFTLATLTQGANVTITNGPGGAITIAAAGGGEVPAARTISTTSPLAGGGDLSADRTFSVGGLAAMGTGNYAVGVNAGGTGWEYKQLVEGANVTITHGVGTITIAGSAATTVNGLSGAVTLAAGTGIDIPAPVGQTITISTTGVVMTTRSISTTTPLAGGGDLSADRTLTVGGLAAIGTANYVVGVNAAGNAWEYKQLVEGNGIDITHAAGSVTIACSAINASGVYTPPAASALGNLGADETIDWATSAMKLGTVDASTTLTFSNPIVGVMLLILTHDATANAYTVTWPATVKWPDGGVAPTLTNTASSVDVFSFVWNGTNYFGQASRTHV